MDKFLLDKSEAVLLIVDIQERLAAIMSERQKVVTNCLHLIEAARLLQIPVIVTEQYPRGLGPTVAELRDALIEYKPVEKITFSCCLEKNFMNILEATGRKKVIMTGMETHICVLQTTLGLLKSGRTVHLLQDAACSRTKENYRAGTELMRDAGAVVTCTETVLFQLLERAGSDEFRTISKRIK